MPHVQTRPDGKDFNCCRSMDQHQMGFGKREPPIIQLLIPWYGFRWHNGLEGGASFKITRPAGISSRPQDPAASAVWGEAGRGLPALIHSYWIVTRCIMPRNTENPPGCGRLFSGTTLDQRMAHRPGGVG